MVAFEPGINFIELIRRKRGAINGILNERHGIHLPSKPIIGGREMRNKKGVREMEEIKKLKRLLFMQKIVLLLQISALIVQVSSLLKH